MAETARSALALGQWRSDMTQSHLSEAQLAQFGRDGFLAIRGLISVDEIESIREAFMQQAAGGPVPGLSDLPRGAVASNDPLSRYPRMMHPHKHEDKEVGRLAMRYM